MRSSLTFSAGGTFPVPTLNPKTNSGFSLTELLMVITIIGLLAVVSLSAVPSILRSRTISDNAYKVKYLIDHAAATAKARNRPVWLAVGEQTISGRASLYMVGVVGRSGSSSDLTTGNIEPLINPVALENTQLIDAAVTSGADSVIQTAGLGTLTQTVAGQPCSFQHIVAFTPDGTAKVKDVMSRSIEFGLQPAATGGKQTEQFLVLVSGMSSQATVNQVSIAQR